VRISSASPNRFRPITCGCAQAALLQSGFTSVTRAARSIVSLTYARGEALSDVQRAALREEGASGDPPVSLTAVVRDVDAIIDRALRQLAATPRESLLDERKLGRAGLPTTVLGLLFHAAEHCSRHVGQAITTAKIVGDGRL
jgi:hypothetical protein